MALRSGTRGSPNNPRPKGATSGPAAAATPRARRAARTTTDTGPVETAMARLVDAMDDADLLPLAGQVQAALCIAAARGLDQALTADNQYGIRQSVVSIRELLTDLQALHTARLVDDDPLDLLLAGLADGPSRT